MREVRVVVDQSSNAGKIAIAATFAASLGVFVAVGMAVRSEGL